MMLYCELPRIGETTRHDRSVAYRRQRLRQSFEQRLVVAHEQNMRHGTQSIRARWYSPVIVRRKITIRDGLVRWRDDVAPDEPGPMR
jgi:hypothetical protein